MKEENNIHCAMCNQSEKDMPGRIRISWSDTYSEFQCNRCKRQISECKSTDFTDVDSLGLRDYTETTKLLFKDGHYKTVIRQAAASPVRIIYSR